MFSLVILGYIIRKVARTPYSSGATASRRQRTRVVKHSRPWTIRNLTSTKHRAANPIYSMSQHPRALGTRRSCCAIHRWLLRLTQHYSVTALRLYRAELLRDIFASTSLSVVCRETP